MRQLTLNELEDKFLDYIMEVEQCPFSDVKENLTQLFNFLKCQDISNRILERIENDFKNINEILKPKFNNYQKPDKQKIDLYSFTPEMQGAFAYFTILDKFQKENKQTPHYINLSRDWYKKGKDYYEYQQNFNNYFLKPFKKLFLWYIYESKTSKDSDFFSYKEGSLIFKKLDDLEKMIIQLGYGQEIIFE